MVKRFVEYFDSSKFFNFSIFNFSNSHPNIFGLVQNNLKYMYIFSCVNFVYFVDAQFLPIEGYALTILHKGEIVEEYGRRNGMNQSST